MELVNNILKHSHATEAKISLTRSQNKLTFLIEDNGIGIFKNNSDGKRMKNVQARVKSLQGTLELVSEENKGTKSTILIPV